MRKSKTKKHDEYLEINIELKKGVASSASMRKKITEKITAGLRKENSEFNYLYTMEGAQKLLPTCDFILTSIPNTLLAGLSKNGWRNNTPMNMSLRSPAEGQSTQHEQPRILREGTYS